MKTNLLFKVILFLFSLLTFNKLSVAQVIDLSRPSIYNGYFIDKSDSTLANYYLNNIKENPESINAFVQKNRYNKAGEETSLMSTVGSPLHPHIPTVHSLSTDKHVGEIPINSSISPTGATVYNVTIDGIPGINGLYPNISITYNSQQINGIIGSGWGISGLSSISLTGKSLYHNGVAEQLKLKEFFVFTLDGNRLIQTSVLSNSSTFIDYITETGNIKIRAYIKGSVGNRFINCFRVNYPNGFIGIFGYESNSNTPYLSYPLIKLSDNFDNTINYSYTYRNEHYYISSIDYGGNNSTGNYASMKFIYKGRNNITTGYAFGKKIIEDYLLDKITCYSGSTVLRTYNLTYIGKNETNSSLLSQIDCTIGSKGLNPLKFYYGFNENGNNIKNEKILLNTYLSLPNASDIIVQSERFTDGNKSLSDQLIVLPNKLPFVRKDNSPYWISGYSENQIIYIYDKLYNDGRAISTLKTEKAFSQILSANIDGKNKNEIIKINFERTYDSTQFIFNIYNYESDGLKHNKKHIINVGKSCRSSAITPAPALFYVGDFNGDGKDELLGITMHGTGGYNDSRTKSHVALVDLEKGCKIYQQLSPFEWHYDEGKEIVFPLDYDGDGKTDICLINEKETSIYTFIKHGNSYQFQKIATIPGLKYNSLYTATESYSKKLLVGDINGDGKTDLLLTPAASYYRSWFQYLPVNSHRYCPCCYGSYPTHATANCRYCNQYLPPSSNCFSCGSSLTACDTNPYYSYSLETAKDSVNHNQHVRPPFNIDTTNSLKSNISPASYYNPDSWNCCRNCGQFAFAQIMEYVDHGNSWTIWFSKGDGTFEEKQIVITDRKKNEEHLLVDMNGDGKSDLVIRDEYGYLKTFLAKNGEINSSQEPKTIKVSSKSTLIPSSLPFNNGESNSHLVVFDISNITKVSYTNHNLHNLLTGMVNSYGVTSKIDYSFVNTVGSYDKGVYVKSSKNYNYPFSHADFNYWVTSKTENYLKDKMLSSLKYQYFDGVIHKQGLGFMGFEKVINTNTFKGQSVTQTFDPLNYGTMITEETPISKITNDYNIAIASNKKLNISIKKRTLYDKLKNQTITLAYTYDDYNNPTKEIIDYGGGINTSNISTYSNIVTESRYVIGIPLTKTTTQIRVGASWTTRVDFAYNQNYKIQNQKENIQNNLVGENQWTYDKYGNVLSEKSRAFNSNDWLVSSYSYSSDGRFLLTETNPFGQVNENIYDQSKCLLIKTKDFKGNEIKYSYDELGRINKTEYPTGVQAESLLNWSINENTIYSVTEKQTLEPTQTSYFDAFNREMKKSIVGFNGQEISSEHEYDDYGRLSRISEQHFGSSPSRWTVNSYDSYDQLIQVNYPSGKTIKYTYGSNFVKTEDGNITKTQTMDATGALIKITDAAGDITYTLRPDGQPSEITAPGGIKTLFEYDSYGRKIKLTDPSFGATSYMYDIYSNISKQTNANGKNIEMVYNKYGQITQKILPEFSTLYTYNSDNLISNIISNNNTSKNYTYDQLLRVTSEIERGPDNVQFSKYYQYSNGKIAFIRYLDITGAPVFYNYNSNGYLASISFINIDIWKPTNSDRFGNITSSTRGNGTSTSMNYNDDGLLTGIKTIKGNNVIQNTAYTFDNIKGLLLTRNDLIYSKTENFGYDNQMRLTSYGTVGNTSFNISYSNTGNIISKSDAGEMIYNAYNKPYAISEIRSNPSTIPIHEQDVSYTSFDRPESISENQNKADFTYNDSYKRVKMQTTSNGTVQGTRYYFGDCYDRELNGDGSIKAHRLYLGGSYYNAPAVFVFDNNVANIYYLHRDHLGSITQITDSDGNKIAEYNYDPWGRMRNPNTQDLRDSWFEPNLLLNRGFTGHEHLPLFGLINMNARLYDPVVGRFLSADPYVQAPDYSQSFNRYSYAVNNPLSYVDQSGEYWWLTIPLVVGSNWIVGAAANNWDFNPGNWDWSKTTFMVGFNNNNFYAGMSWDGTNISGLGFNGNLNYIAGQMGNTSSISTVELLKFFRNNPVNQFNNYRGIITASDPSWVYNWSQSDNFFAELSYGIVDGFAVALQSPFLSNESSHINGDQVRGNDRMNALVGTTSLIMPIKGGV